ncbi:3-phosphoshikimate 1-carboxyvinyltransferase [SAR86 cluster bacterium]|nr:3-phosphoshikimate 1-carboxyvinyltransferase [SAR86 cluster bacterium]
MDIKLLKSTNLNGQVNIPGDKSISHRSIILSAIAEGISEISGYLKGEDCLATLNAFKQMGIKIEEYDQKIKVYGNGLHGLRKPCGDLNLGNSGTSMRLLAGLLSGQKFSSNLIGDDSLSSRPMGRIIEPLKKMGASIYAKEKSAPIAIDVSEGLEGISYELPVASAQVKSCIMLAALYAKTETRIIENHQTRNHTEKMFQKFGIEIQEEIEDEKKIIKISPSQEFYSTTIDIPGDFSSASFLIVAALIIPNSEITLKNIGINSSRTALLKVLVEMGADIKINNVKENIERSADILIKTSSLNAIVLDEKLIPNLIDELPILFIASTFAKGKTIIRGAGELRTKESDRLEAMSNALGNLGVKFQSYRDGIDIIGNGSFESSVTIDSFGDHRIAMASSIACTMLDGKNRVKNVDNIQTSFPNFIETCNSLGIKAELLK